jgi:arginine decarboxylase
LRGPRGKPCLELHPCQEGEPYILGIFLTGAYQEILGDLHNLFGDTNAVHIKVTERRYEVTDLVEGDTVTEVLNYVQFRAIDLIATFRRKVANAQGPLPDRSQRLHRGLSRGARGVHVPRGEVAPAGGGRRGNHEVNRQRSTRRALGQAHSKEHKQTDRG